MKKWGMRNGSNIRQLRKPLSALALLLFPPLAPAQAASAILVWPVNPIIEPDKRAVALWLENRGKEPAMLQLRIFGWSQADGESRYVPQNDVVGTPPMIRIEPGKRQLVRLTRTTDVPAGVERAFRVIVDEIPAPETNDAQSVAAAAGIRFQMRYSIPLFVYGDGLQSKARTVPDRTRQALGWRSITLDGEQYIEVENRGLIHARLTKAEFRQGDAVEPIAAGLLGYVLPGTVARWPLPRGVEPKGTLRVAVNGAEPVEISRTQ